MYCAPQTVGYSIVELYTALLKMLGAVCPTTKHAGPMNRTLYAVHKNTPDGYVFRSCCFVYSYGAMAPLTCTLSERMRPSCGISTVASSRANTWGQEGRSKNKRGVSHREVERAASSRLSKTEAACRAAHGGAASWGGS